MASSRDELKEVGYTVFLICEAKYVTNSADNISLDNVKNFNKVTINTLIKTLPKPSNRSTAWFDDIDAAVHYAVEQQRQGGQRICFIEIPLSKLEAKIQLEDIYKIYPYSTDFEKDAKLNVRIGSAPTAEMMKAYEAYLAVCHEGFLNPEFPATKKRAEKAMFTFGLFDSSLKATGPLKAFVKEELYDHQHNLVKEIFKFV